MAICMDRVDGICKQLMIEALNYVIFMSHNPIESIIFIKGNYHNCKLK